jgi:hypothetical protein
MSTAGVKRSSVSPRRITREELNHLRDPIAKMVWQHWIATGEALLVEETPNLHIQERRAAPSTIIVREEGKE